MIKREIDATVEKLNFIPDGRLEEYLQGKNLVRPVTADYESSVESDAAYWQGRANVAANSKRKEERRNEGKRR